MRSHVNVTPGESTHPFSGGVLGATQKKKESDLSKRAINTGCEISGTPFKLQYFIAYCFELDNCVFFLYALVFYCKSPN